MVEVNFVASAIERGKLAIKYDNEGDYREALKFYKQSLDYLSAALKYEKSKTLKDTLKEKMEEYLNRAEVLKEHLEKQEKKTPVAANGAISSGAAPLGDKSGSGRSEEQQKMREVLLQTITPQKSNIKWDDIAGLVEAKSALKEAVILPMQFPHLFTGKRTPWKGILMYGPPGTGKTQLAKALANEANATFYSISSADVISKWMGESERLIRELFDVARDNKPCVIFIDEVDSLCGKRDGNNENDASRRVKNEIIGRWPSSDESGILIVGATNMPWDIDSAVRRRFERRIYIPLPTESARIQIIELAIGSTPNSLTKEDFRYLARQTEGYSGADISTLARDALYEPVRKVQEATHFKKIRIADRKNPEAMKDYLTPCSPGDEGASEMTWQDVKSDELMEPIVSLNDLMKALARTKPSVNQDDLAEYRRFTEEFGLEG